MALEAEPPTFGDDRLSDTPAILVSVDGGGAVPAPASLRIVRPDDPRLRVAFEAGGGDTADVTVDPGQPLKVGLTASWAEPRAPPPGSPPRRVAS